MNQEEWWRLEHWARLFPKEIAAREPELLIAQAWVARSQYQTPAAAGPGDAGGSSLGGGAETILSLLTARELQCSSWKAKSSSCAPSSAIGKEIWPAWCATACAGWRRRRSNYAPSATVALMFLCGAYQANGDLPGAYALHEDQLAAASTQWPHLPAVVLARQGPVQAIAGDLPALADNINRIACSGPETCPGTRTQA